MKDEEDLARRSRGRGFQVEETGPHAGKCLVGCKNRTPVGSESSEQGDMVAGERLRPDENAVVSMTIR